ncbi:SDR family oxidoreductase [Streptomyces sp. FXJ1.4098]|nr:SDR family oxidoreductase [Streptomyces sp. FXJ1.4098]
MTPRRIASKRVLYPRFLLPSVPVRTGPADAAGPSDERGDSGRPRRSLYRGHRCRARHRTVDRPAARLGGRTPGRHRPRSRPRRGRTRRGGRTRPAGARRTGRCDAGRRLRRAGPAHRRRARAARRHGLQRGHRAGQALPGDHRGGLGRHLRGQRQGHVPDHAGRRRPDARPETPGRRPPRGKIITMSSIAGRYGAGPMAPLTPHYRASKASVISLTQTAAYALAPDITVNAICPGLVETDMWRQIDQEWAAAEGWSEGEAWKRRTAVVPMGRPQTPDDVAGLARYLCSPDSDYMTGQALNIDGGLIMS